jgi:hypothetical protein
VRSVFGDLARIYIAAIPGALITIRLLTHLQPNDVLDTILLVCSTGALTMLPGLAWNAIHDERERERSAHGGGHTETERREAP